MLKGPEVIETLQEDSKWIPDAIVLGKGPSAARRAVYLKRFPFAILVTLNHAIRWADCRARVWAHFVDVEALEECWADVKKKSTHLLLPSVMNRDFHRSSEPFHLADGPPCLTYDRDEVGMRVSSVEGAVGAVGMMRYRKILLCGIDGGTDYAPGLEDVQHTRLANGRRSFDDQWKPLSKIVERLGLEVRRVAVEG
jgi:hypothetical protein